MAQSGLPLAFASGEGFHMLPANSDAREWRDSSGGGTAVTLNARSWLTPISAQI